MPDFKLVAPFEPTGDQPKAIEGLIDGLGKGLNHQVLLGATGTGKTYTLAKVIEKVNRPTLVLAHNKTLAAQLYAEFRESFSMYVSLRGRYASVSCIYGLGAPVDYGA